LSNGKGDSNGKNQNNNRTFEDLDGFWELDALMPPRATPYPRSVDVETVEVSLGEREPDNRGSTAHTGAADLRMSHRDNGTRRSDGREGEMGERKPRDLTATPMSSDSPKNGKYAPITASYRAKGGGKIDYATWLQRRKDGDGRDITGMGADERFEYIPENPLIFRARVVRRCDFDGIEERSLSDMRMLADVTAEFSENVEFTALFPQYSRMTDEQRICYIGFRTEALNGRFPQVSESYILFFLYEIINLSERFPPREAVKLICSLMCEYRNCSDSLFSFMCDWLADYCLINRFSAPFELLAPIRERVYKRATWKEFYVPFNAEAAEPDACVLLSTASDYDYRGGKFYTAETADCFETHIPKAIGAVLRAGIGLEPAAAGEKKDITTLSHDAFRGAFRSARLRYTVSIDCACFTRSPLLRQTVTAMVKYAENFVREMLGIRSRLSVSCLAGDKKETIKAYFEPFIKHESQRAPLKRGRKKKNPDGVFVPTVPEYEKYYEPQSEGFSPELAAKIESDSWETTGLLLNAFGEEGRGAGVEPSNVGDIAEDTVNSYESELDFAVEQGPKADEGLVETNGAEDDKCASSEKATCGETGDFERMEIRGLKLLLHGKSREFSLLARDCGLLADTLAERINEMAIDVYGDIAVESDGSIDGFAIVEDYRDELTDIVGDG